MLKECPKCRARAIVCELIHEDMELIIEHCLTCGFRKMPANYEEARIRKTELNVGRRRVKRFKM